MSVAVIYLRVSTSKQAETGFSLENQLSRLQAYALVHNYTNVKVISDEGISGRSTKNRVGFNEMIELVKSRECSAIIVYSLSRFARNVKDTIETIDLLNKYGVSFHSLTESIDTTTAVGRFFLTTLSALAQLESEQMGERIKSVLEHKKDKGERIGQVPFGYNDENGILVDNSDELETIKLVKSLKDEQGLSYDKIAEELIRQERKNKKGQVKWLKSQVIRLYKKGVTEIKETEK
ncbi:MAG TPA: recombinase family protein [Ignavibacteriales bacterium]|nr:recombinase family protein [Ignavibacteriales bacterium]